jgi:hypothetical protein
MQPLVEVALRHVIDASDVGECHLSWINGAFLAVARAGLEKAQA